VDKKLNEIINRLNKTKEDKKPDLRALREERDGKVRDGQKAKMREDKQVEKELEDKKRKDAELRSVF